VTDLEEFDVGISGAGWDPAVGIAVLVHPCRESLQVHAIGRGEFLFLAIQVQMDVGQNGKPRGPQMLV